MGPFNLTQSGVTTSSLGMVPKSMPGKFGVIVDLSSPTKLSVNDQTHRELAQVAFSSIEDAALLMHALGPGTRLKLTSRRLIVGSQYIPSRGPSWQCYGMVAYALIASSRLALHQHPQSSAVVEALEWILSQRGVQGVLHYLDDFLLLGAPDSLECTHGLATTIAICEELGVPLAEENIEGPVTSLTFLGICLCSNPLQVPLPQEKHDTLQSMLQQIIGARCVRDAATWSP